MLLRAEKELPRLLWVCSKLTRAASIAANTVCWEECGRTLLPLWYGLVTSCRFQGLRAVPLACPVTQGHSLDFFAFIFFLCRMGFRDWMWITPEKMQNAWNLHLSSLLRCERLEEQLNDLTELHQNEILNLKQELASMEEKIAYQSYERARDIQVSKKDRSKIFAQKTSWIKSKKYYCNCVSWRKKHYSKCKQIHSTLVVVGNFRVGKLLSNSSLHALAIG